MPDGKSRNAVNFGKFWKSGWGLDSTSLTASFDLNRTVTDMRTGFLVFADDANMRQYLFSAQSRSNYDFYRGNSGALFNATYASAKVCNGRYWLDGEPAAANTVPAEGFHLFSIETTDNVMADAIAIGYRQGFGGISVCEQVVLNGTISDNSRLFYEKVLSQKWFGSAAGHAFDLDDVEIADGAELSLGSLNVRTANLTGAGTVTVDELTVSTSLAVGGEAPATQTVTGNLTFADGSSLVLDWTTNGCDTVAVTGAVSGAPTVNVAFHGVKPVAGDYVLMSAGDLSAVDVSALALVTDLPADKRQFASLKKIGNTLVLQISKSGLLVIVR